MAFTSALGFLKFSPAKADLQRLLKPDDNPEFLLFHKNFCWTFVIGFHIVEGALLLLFTMVVFHSPKFGVKQCYIYCTLVG